MYQGGKSKRGGETKQSGKTEESKMSPGGGTRTHVYFLVLAHLDLLQTQKWVQISMVDLTLISGFLMFLIGFH